MKKCLSLIIALVMVLGLLTVGGPVFLTTAGAVDQLIAPDAWWDGTTICWKDAPNTTRYKVTVHSLVPDGEHSARVEAEWVINRNGDDMTFMTVAGYSPTSATYSSSAGYRFDVSSIIYSSEQYWFSITSSATSAEQATSKDVVSEAVVGQSLKNGYQSRPPLRGSIAITGTAEIGRTLVATVTLENPTPIAETDLTYQWEYRAKDNPVFTGPGSSLYRGKGLTTFNVPAEHEGKYVNVEVYVDGYSGRISGEEVLIKENVTTHPATFTTQPTSGTASKQENYMFSWDLSDPAGEVESVVLQYWFPEDADWAAGPDLTGKTSHEVSYAPILADNDVSKYRLSVSTAQSQIFSNEFTVNWTDEAPGPKFTEQPKSGTASETENYTFSWKLSDPTSAVESVVLQYWYPAEADWAAGPNVTGKTSHTVEYAQVLADKNDVTKYRLSVSTAQEQFFSDEFTVTWTEATPTTYTITFDPNGGTVSPVTAATGTDGKLASFPTPTREGYTFDGWYENADLRGDKITAIAKGDTQKKVFYAKWVISQEQAIALMKDEMVTVIPAGNKGSLDNFAGAEGTTIINAYEIAKHEVTQELYTTVMGENPSDFNKAPADGEVQEKRPVECVFLVRRNLLL